MTVKPEKTGVTYSGKAYRGIEALGPLVEPFGAEARGGNTGKTFFITSPEPLSSEVRTGLEVEGFVITDNF